MIAESKRLTAAWVHRTHRLTNGSTEFDIAVAFGEEHHIVQCTTHSNRNSTAKALRRLAKMVEESEAPK